MPSSIPFDHPSLVLGNVVNPQLLSKLKNISTLQAKTDAAQDKMNSHITLKRSLSMTINELINMNVDVTPLLEKIKEVDTSIVTAATDYATVRLANETAIQALKEQVSEMDTDDSLESPIDYNRTLLKQMPLGSDSLKLDAQYFSYEQNNEDNPLNVIASIGDYIQESTSGLGAKASADIAKTASGQIALQRKNHSVSGTLIITASCTHKNAVLLAPLLFDADKTVTVWNMLNKSSRISTTDLAAVQAIAEEEEENPQQTLPVLSGATYGSSFVGMVHVLKQENTANSSGMSDVAAKLQERFNIGGWFEESSGGFGVDPSFSDDIRNLLSSQTITSHINVVVMGAVPSIRSNQVEMGVKTFAEFDATKLTTSLASIENATAAEKVTVDQAANTARTGAKLLAMQGATIQSVMLGLGKIDQGSNKMLDINSMMTAFEDYLQEVKNGNAGVPVNFYVKYITKRQVAQGWLDKYYPDNSTNAPSTE